MHSISPVFGRQNVEKEKVLGLGIAGHKPTIALNHETEDGYPISMARMQLSPEERELVAAGADLLVYFPGHDSWRAVGLQWNIPVKEGGE